MNTWQETHNTLQGTCNRLDLCQSCYLSVRVLAIGSRSVECAFVLLVTASPCAVCENSTFGLLVGEQRNTQRLA